MRTTSQMLFTVMHSHFNNKIKNKWCYGIDREYSSFIVIRDTFTTQLFTLHKQATLMPNSLLHLLLEITFHRTGVPLGGWALLASIHYSILVAKALVHPKLQLYAQGPCITITITKKRIKWTYLICSIYSAVIYISYTNNDDGK